MAKRNASNKLKTTTDITTQTTMTQYGQIRQNFLNCGQFASGNNSSNSSLVDGAHGFFKSQGDPFNQVMTSRVGGFNTLFDTLVQGIVEDPDYALRKDWRIYERLQRDPQIFYCLQVRKAATAGLPWSLIPPVGYEKDEDALKYAREAEIRIRAIPRFTTLLRNLLEALLSGISISELVWEVNDNGYYVVRKHFPMNKDRFRFTATGQLRLLSPSSPTIGHAIPDYKFMKHTYGISDGSWKETGKMGYAYYGRGLADTPLYHYFFFKVTALKFYLQALERHGNPTKFIWTGAQNSQLASKLTEVMLALKNDSVVNIPGKKGEIDIEVMSDKGRSAPQMFQFFIEYIDRLITRAILGQDLMTENISSTGSRSAAQVHKSVFGWLAEEDKNALQHTLNDTLLTFDAELNMPNIPKEKRPIFRFKQAAAEDAAAFLLTVKNAQDLGLDISLSQLRERTGLREPLDEEDKLIAQPEIDPRMEVDPKQSVQSKLNRKTKPKSNANPSTKPPTQLNPKPVLKDKPNGVSKPKISAA